MKKSNFTALILGTVGIVFFALGMCMALVEEWGLFRKGIIAGERKDRRIGTGRCAGGAAAGRWHVSVHGI